MTEKALEAFVEGDEKSGAKLVEQAKRVNEAAVRDVHEELEEDAAFRARPEEAATGLVEEESGVIKSEEKTQMQKTTTASAPAFSCSSQPQCSRICSAVRLTNDLTEVELISQNALPIAISLRQTERRYRSATLSGVVAFAVDQLRCDADRHARGWPEREKQALQESAVPAIAPMGQKTNSRFGYPSCDIWDRPATQCAPAVQLSRLCCIAA